MNPSHTQSVASRQRWMSILAKADAADLEAACKTLGELPPMQWLRQPETGLVMVRGRIGGSGAKFNLGEVPVTRCAVRLGAGAVGIAWVQGRDTRHAEWAARLDAVLQDGQYQGLQQKIREHVLEPLAAAQVARHDLRARKAAATRVEFYTLAREAACA